MAKALRLDDRESDGRRDDLRKALRARAAVRTQRLLSNRLVVVGQNRDTKESGDCV